MGVLDLLDQLGQTLFQFGDLQARCVGFDLGRQTRQRDAVDRDGGTDEQQPNDDGDAYQGAVWARFIAGHRRHGCGSTVAPGRGAPSAMAGDASTGVA
ncbi:hypothetical protein D3C76_1522410 [compost metagenome]